MRSRINRLESLRIEIMAHCAILAQEEGKELEAFLEKGLTDTYYKGMYDEYINKNPDKGYNDNENIILEKIL